MRMSGWVLVLGAGLAGAAQAQTLDCSNAMTQREINACLGRAFEAADADLNAAYGQARDQMRQIDSGLSPDQQGAELALRDGQRAWISFRDNACAAEGFQMRGGSGEPMLVLGCKARLTQVRAQDLWTLAAGMEG
ncbi:lysozyme inhibitor LprI family protein [Pseudotabrizicola formosa]|uniref:lysozyme inhibitor LprI family protein n=1 Tax=Pseudotabrizicola formosa TaxID=2030009 RepID=UPI000CD10F88|nr:lysozyme inhibitor LprI family protein [Pseudotabrizicola formosa]